MTESLLPHSQAVQINLHHSLTATAQLRKWLEVNNTAVALIQDPWLSRSGSIQGLNNLKGKIITGNINQPRAAIYITNNIPMHILTNFCSRDICTIVTASTTSSQEVVLSSVYMPDGEDPPPQDLVRLVNYCEAEGLDLIVATDSNCHHTIWGSTNTNSRGKKLIEYLSTTNLDIINRGNKPTFVTRRAKTIIDLTLANEGGANLISNWHVSDELSCSDHRWIRFQLGLTPTAPLPFRNVRKTNKEMFRRLLNEGLRALDYPDKLTNTKSIEQLVTKITDLTTKCYEATCPLIHHPENRGGDLSSNALGQG